MQAFFDLFLRDIGGNAPPSGDCSALGSVISAVGILLNTRSPYSASAIAQMHRRTVLDYGLPDFFHHASMGKEDVVTLANLIRNTIAAHEPRFCVESVSVDRRRQGRGVLDVTISGRLFDKERAGPLVSFPVEVGATQGI